MDSLILTFNQKQLNLYNELLEKENINLNFDTTLPAINTFFVIDFDEVLSNIKTEADTLLKLNKHTLSFSPSFTQEEIKDLTPIYYNAIRQIKRHANVISSESYKLSFKLGEINSALANINKRYTYFLPYKAALYNREDYSLKIDEIDFQFKNSIQTLNNLKIEILSLFERSINITNIVNDFIQKSSKATDEPKFKKFDAYDFFWSLEAFIEQIRNI